jgi:hypothetical protein
VRCAAIPTVVVALLVASAANAADRATIRWSESDSRCAFRAEDDGTYRYAIASDTFSITLAMDAQELEKSRQRPDPVLGLFLSIQFFSGRTEDFDPRKITLEFTKHFHTTENPLDSIQFTARLRARETDTEKSTARSLQKHPKNKEEIETSLRDQRQENLQLIDWIKTGILTGTKDAHDIRGWLLFAARSRWIGPLNPQEEFVLRVPLGKEAVEFPFTLPPSRGDIRLRSRPAD